MILEEIILHVEALVFASDKPLPSMDITNIMVEAYPEDEVNTDSIQNALDTIKAKYDTEFHSFRMVETGGGFQFLTKSDFHATIAKLNGDKFMKRLSAAALETLAIIAYRQPITKPDCEYIRGVSCDYSIQKLLEKELIVISGRNEEAVGKPLLYNTSRSFMDYLGINSIDDLPRLREIVGEDIVLPTQAIDAVPQHPDTALVVSESGELQEVELPVSVLENEEVSTKETISEKATADDAIKLENKEESSDSIEDSSIIVETDEQIGNSEEPNHSDDSENSEEKA
jgi:segregation and condensation protein B